jgi:hypothetical protein
MAYAPKKHDNFDVPLKLLYKTRTWEGYLSDLLSGAKESSIILLEPPFYYYIMD